MRCWLPTARWRCRTGAVSCRPSRTGVGFRVCAPCSFHRHGRRIHTAVQAQACPPHPKTPTRSTWTLFWIELHLPQTMCSTGSAKSGWIWQCFWCMSCCWTPGTRSSSSCRSLEFWRAPWHFRPRESLQCGCRRPWCPIRSRAWCGSAVRMGWASWRRFCSVCVPGCCRLLSPTIPLHLHSHLQLCLAFRPVSLAWCLVIKTTHLRS